MHEQIKRSMSETMTSGQQWDHIESWDCCQGFRQNLKRGRGGGNSGLLNNTGGPRSRTRSLRINSSFTDSFNIAEESTSVALWVPEHLINPGDWVTELCRKIGFKSPEEAEQKLNLPPEKLLVAKREKHTECPGMSETDRLRNALILARCNDSFYKPDSPLIFTRKRLHRSLHLIKINLKNYYELD